MNRGLVQLPITIDRSSGMPIQDQLFFAIRELILHDIAKPLMRLPPSRDLSQQLVISRNTVKIAYANLISQGYLLSHGTSGTFVAARLPDSQSSILANKPNVDDKQAHVEVLPERRRIDFAVRGTNPALSPERTWRRLLIKHLPFQARQPTQTDPAGLLVLRKGVATAISPLRGMSVNAAHCVIVTDDYRALDTASRVLTCRNRSVVVEDPCDAGLHYLLRSQGAEVIPVPVDQYGLRVEDLPRTEIAAVVVTPSHQQPTGVTMSRARRVALLDWAKENDAYIIEWDTFSEFCYDYTLVPSLYSLDTSDRVIYINGFSSWISVGAQLCYTILPPSLIKQFLTAKPFLNPEIGWLEQRVAADFIGSDILFSQMRRVQRHHRLVRDAILRTLEERLPDHKLTGISAGRHMVWHLPQEGIGAVAMQRRALDIGIKLPTLNDGNSCFHRERLLYDPERTLLLGYALLDEETARAAIVKLALTLET